MEYLDEFSMLSQSVYVLRTRHKNRLRYRQVEQKAQKITYPVEVVGLLTLDKLWKLLLVSLWLLMTIHLLRSTIRILTQY